MQGGKVVKKLHAAVTLATILALLAVSPAAADSDDDNAKFGEWYAATSLDTTTNSTFADFGPGLSPDGNSLYFASTRPGGSGFADLWVAQRGNKNAPWETPVNLGPTVNSARVDAVPSSSRAGSAALDLWTSTREGRAAAWSTPTNVGSAVNTAANDFQPTLSRDGLTLIFASDRPGGHGSIDLYMATRVRADD